MTGLGLAALQAAATKSADCKESEIVSCTECQDLYCQVCGEEHVKVNNLDIRANLKRRKTLIDKHHDVRDDLFARSDPTEKSIVALQKISDLWDQAIEALKIESCNEFTKTRVNALLEFAHAICYVVLDPRLADFINLYAFPYNTHNQEKTNVDVHHHHPLAPQEEEVSHVDKQIKNLEWLKEIIDDHKELHRHFDWHLETHYLGIASITPNLRRISYLLAEAIQELKIGPFNLFIKTRGNDRLTQVHAISKDVDQTLAILINGIQTSFRYEQLICADCETPAIVYCQECAYEYCHPCGEKIHTNGNRRRHNFNPLQLPTEDKRAKAEAEVAQQALRRAEACREKLVEDEAAAPRSPAETTASAVPPHIDDQTTCETSELAEYKSKLADSILSYQNLVTMRSYTKAQQDALFSNIPVFFQKAIASLQLNDVQTAINNLEEAQALTNNPVLGSVFLGEDQKASLKDITTWLLQQAVYLLLITELEHYSSLKDDVIYTNADEKAVHTDFTQAKNKLKQDNINDVIFFLEDAKDVSEWDSLNSFSLQDPSGSSTQLTVIINHLLKLAKKLLPSQANVDEAAAPRSPAAAPGEAAGEAAQPHGDIPTTQQVVVPPPEGDEKRKPWYTRIPVISRFASFFVQMLTGFWRFCGFGRTQASE